jgi:hypothetical protein
MFAALGKFAKLAGLKGIKAATKADGLTREQRDQAVEDGMAYFRKNKINFCADDRDLRSAVRGLQTIAAMNDHPVQAAAAEQALLALNGWAEMQIIASLASTYASLFHQGQTSTYWSEAARLHACEACKFFRI